MHTCGKMGWALLVLVGLVTALDASSLRAQQPGPETQAFHAVFAQWKTLLADLRKLQEDYQKADQTGRAEISKKYEALVQQGSQLEPKLIAGAEKAYQEAPNKDEEILKFLVAVLRGEVAADEYESAIRVGEMLVKNEAPEPDIYNAAGIAAFAVGNFDAAEKYLTLAKQKNAIDRLGEQYLRGAAQYKALAAKEAEIRATETKADDLPRVLLKTNKGDIEIELFENEAPNTVANFISLVEGKFYNNLTFHRVLEGFMAQGGDPTGQGAGNPGYSIACECYKPEARMHFRGSLSMAHAGRDTGGSQFFLTFVPTEHLNGMHTCFGRVVGGMDVLAKLQRRDPQSPNPPPPDRIVEAKVLRKRNHPYEPKKLPK